VVRIAWCVVRSKPETLFPDRFDQALQRTRADGVGKRVPGRFAQLTIPLQLSGRQMDGICQSAKKPYLISLDRSGNCRTGPTRILAAKCLNRPFRRGQRLTL
jgi:hypothetical protein